MLDPTLAPPGAHVVSFFTQFTPYHLEGKEWTNQDREAYADLGKNFLKPSKTASVTFSVHVLFTVLTLFPSGHVYILID